MTDDQFLLASAYADDAVSADERALAEADPEVMAEVGRIRALQAQLAGVAPAPPAQRATMIAAAMAEFGVDVAAAPAPAAAPRPGTLRPPTRRPSPFPRLLGVAAAVVGVLAIGGVLVNNLPDGGGDDDSAEAPVTALDDAEPMASREIEGVADATTPSDFAGSAAEIAPAPAPAAPGGDPEADPAATDAAGATAPSVMITAVPLISTPDQLRDFARSLGEADVAASGTEAPSATLAPATTLMANEPCSFALALAAADPEIADQARAAGGSSTAPVEVIGSAEYLTAQGPTPVLVAVDAVTTQAYAIARDGCTLLAVGTAP